MKEKIKKIKAIDVLDWFYKNICVKRCHKNGIKRLDCYEKMRKIITGFEDYPVTQGQFVYSMRIKNKVCDLTEDEFREKTCNEKGDRQFEIEDQDGDIFLYFELEDYDEDGVYDKDGVYVATDSNPLERDSEMEDYDEDGVYNNMDQIGFNGVEIEKDAETGMYKLKR